MSLCKTTPVETNDPGGVTDIQIACGSVRGSQALKTTAQPSHAQTNLVILHITGTDDSLQCD